MGMPDPEQRRLEPDQIMLPPMPGVLVPSHTPTPNPAGQAIEWAVGLFGPGTVLLAAILGGTLLWRRAARKWLRP